MTSAEVEVLATREALMQRAAEHFVAAAADATHVRGRCVVALAGGTTPQRLYMLLAADPYVARVDWSRLHVFWGDERCVPPDDPRSNYHMVRTTLLDHVPVPPGNIHRIRGERVPTTAAAAYEAEIRSSCDTASGAPPPGVFDLVLLGMGDNGHTASLFPHLTAVRERSRWVVAEYVAEVALWRVTLTPVVLNAATQVMFLVSGLEKAATLHRVLEGPHAPDELPAQAIRAGTGRVRWLVDVPAAAQLQHR